MALPKTEKGLERLIRRILREELDKDSNRTKSELVHVMTPDQMKKQQRLDELERMYNDMDYEQF